MFAANPTASDPLPNPDVGLPPKTHSLNLRDDEATTEDVFRVYIYFSNTKLRPPPKTSTEAISVLMQKTITQTTVYNGNYSVVYNGNHSVQRQLQCATATTVYNGSYSVQR